ncbi:MAG: hypothetical protein Roseis2KO_49180 [Roseivirga sp.]
MTAIQKHSSKPQAFTVTPKQADRLRTRIANIRRTLAAEKRKFGWYDDGRGLRYLPPELYIKLEDYKGGLTYLRWFHKNFPDDIGFPDFLFDWTIILFKTSKLKDAEHKAVQTWFANTYLFDAYFGRAVTPIDKSEFSNLETPEFVNHFDYSATQGSLADFTVWLAALEESEHFRITTSKFIGLQKRLSKETDVETRSYLIKQCVKLLEDY